MSSVAKTSDTVFPISRSPVSNHDRKVTDNTDNVIPAITPASTVPKPRPKYAAPTRSCSSAIRDNCASRAAGYRAAIRKICPVRGIPANRSATRTTVARITSAGRNWAGHPAIASLNAPA